MARQRVSEQAGERVHEEVGGEEVGAPGAWGVGDGVDSDDQREDEERQPLLCHPDPHLAAVVSESTGGNWGNQRNPPPSEG